MIISKYWYEYHNLKCLCLLASAIVDVVAFRRVWDRKKRYPEIQPMNVPNTVRRLDHSRTYTLDFIVAISLLPREVATETETARVCRKLRPRKTQAARVYRELRTRKNSDPLGVTKTQTPGWIENSVRSLKNSDPPGVSKSHTHLFYLIFAISRRNTVKMLLMAIEKFRMLLYTKWNEMFMKGTVAVNISFQVWVFVTSVEVELNDHWAAWDVNIVTLLTLCPIMRLEAVFVSHAVFVVMWS